MKKRSKKEKEVIPPHRSGVVVKWLLIVCHSLLCYAFFMGAPMTYIGAIIMVGLVISLLYWVRYKKRMFDDVGVETGIRHVMSYVLTTMTAFFYTLAMYRSDQLTNFTQNLIIGGSFFMYYCLFSASRGFIKRS